MAIAKPYVQTRGGCAHTPLQANGFFGRLHQCLWYRCDPSEEIPKCIFCGASLQSPVENYFIRLSVICFALSLAIHWFVWTYIIDILVELMPIKLLLVVLFLAVSYILEFISIRIASACVCAGVQWKEIVFSSHNEDTYKAMTRGKHRTLRNGLQQAWTAGLATVLVISAQIPIGFLVLIDAAASLIRRLFSREYRYLWVWVSTLVFSALAIVAELFWENIFVTSLLKYLAVLVIAIILMVDNYLDMN